MTRSILRLLAITVVTLFVGACGSTSTQRSVGEYTDDTGITARVKLALANTPGVKATAIQVETYRGVVQLSGFADSADMIQLAVNAARQVSGVREVKNDVRLRAQQ